MIFICFAIFITTALTALILYKKSNKEKDIKVEVKYINGKNREFIVNTLPGTFPEYSVEGESEYEGDYYTSTYSKDYDIDHYIFKLDKTREYKIL